MSKYTEMYDVGSVEFNVLLFIVSNWIIHLAFWTQTQNVVRLHSDVPLCSTYMMLPEVKSGYLLFWMQSTLVHSILCDARCIDSLHKCIWNLTILATMIFRSMCFYMSFLCWHLLNSAVTWRDHQRKYEYGPILNSMEWKKKCNIPNELQCSEQ